MIGTKLAHYEITSHLGTGGMGEVYLATDSKLGRSVAIKLLPEAFTHDADRAARFEREARVLASLNHPNIATIHGVEESGGRKFLVMELVPGETLAERIKHGAIPGPEALGIATQIIEALEAAHEKGVIHRDLKPANIKVTPDGKVKVLDFGLAKAYEPQASQASVSQSPTLSMMATMQGVILGTAAYMSPEQAKGKEVDRRTDIFAFGAVLYEMLTGRQAFAGEDVTQILARVLEREPDWTLLPENIPPVISRLLRLCLQKDAKARRQTATDVRIDIKQALAEPEAVKSVTTPTRVSLMGWVVAATAVLVAGVLAIPAVRHLREEPPVPAVPLRFQILTPENTPMAPFLSPDGRKAVFFMGERMWVHSLESGESHDLTASGGGVPFWSTDSRFIGYLSDGKLKKIEATGGPPQTITDLPGNFIWGCGAWNQDDVIVFGDRPVGLFRVPASGGNPVQITSNDPARHENSQYCPSFLPDGKHFVYMRSSTDEGKSAIYLGSIDAKPEQHSSKVLVSSNSQPVYAASADPSTGYLLFVRGDTLMAQAFDNFRLELKGQAVPVAERVRNGITGASYVFFSASANGALAYPRVSKSVSQLTWYDREGKVMGVVGEPGNAVGNPRLSPNGTQLAGTKGAGGADAANIWILDLSRGGASTRFTFGSPIDTGPVWSPDGSRIIFSSNRDGPFNLYQKPVNGVKDEDVLLKSSEDKFATSWSRDGRFLLYTVNHPKTKGDIWVLTLENDKKPLLFLSTKFNERQACFSPDGHWVAYTSDESGKDEVYIRSVSMNSPGTPVETGGQWHVSNGIGTDPHWRGDGHELYYRSGDGTLLAVEIETSPTFRAGDPKPLGSLQGGSWDSAVDGKRFLALVTTGGRPSLTVMLNWQAGMKK